MPLSLIIMMSPVEFTKSHVACHYTLYPPCCVVKAPCRMSTLINQCRGVDYIGPGPSLWSEEYHCSPGCSLSIHQHTSCFGKLLTEILMLIS